MSPNVSQWVITILGLSLSTYAEPFAGEKDLRTNPHVPVLECPAVSPTIITSYITITSTQTATSSFSTNNSNVTETSASSSSPIFYPTTTAVASSTWNYNSSSTSVQPTSGTETATSVGTKVSSTRKRRTRTHRHTRSRTAKTTSSRIYASLTTTNEGLTTTATASSTTLIPQPLDCQEDNCLRQLIRAPEALGYCSGYTTEVLTATTGLPEFVNNCENRPSRISSACSCIATGGPVTTPIPASTMPHGPDTTVIITQTCHQDNCLRQFLQSPTVSGFCATYTQAVNTATSDLPDYISMCEYDPFRISSACSCIAAPTNTGDNGSLSVSKTTATYTSNIALTSENVSVSSSLPESTGCLLVTATITSTTTFVITLTSDGYQPTSSLLDPESTAPCDDDEYVTETESYSESYSWADSETTSMLVTSSRVASSSTSALWIASAISTDRG